VLAHQVAIRRQDVGKDGVIGAGCLLQRLPIEGDGDRFAGAERLSWQVVADEPRDLVEADVQWVADRGWSEDVFFCVNLDLPQRQPFVSQREDHVRWPFASSRRCDQPAVFDDRFAGPPSVRRVAAQRRCGGSRGQLPSPLYQRQPWPEVREG